jgi:hypothetical protein
MIDKFDHRKNKGEDKGSSKLTEEQVLRIKELCFETDLSDIKIGKMFNVSPGPVYLIRHNKTWNY